VVDDALPRDLFDELVRLSEGPLLYGARSNFASDPHGHWSRDFVGAGPENLADVADRFPADATTAPIEAAWRLLTGRRLKQHVLIRCYINGYTYGTEGYFHADSKRPDEHTVILYLNNYWEPDWAGETVFLGGADVIKAVLPRPNRAVIFPSRIEHSARSVSRKCMVLRKTLVFKARRRRSAGFEGLSDFLRKIGAAERRHRSGSLHDHLVRIYSLLEGKGLDQAVCFGGGLHAVYGTRFFQPGVLTLDSRPDVARAFGARAEELAHLFSVLDRPNTLEAPHRQDAQIVTVALSKGGTVDLARGTFDGLRAIECANLQDQEGLGRYPRLRTAWETQWKAAPGL
jgi:hypothetical protein